MLIKYIDFVNSNRGYDSSANKIFMGINRIMLELSFITEKHSVFKNYHANFVTDLTIPNDLTKYQIKRINRINKSRISAHVHLDSVH